MVHQWTSHFAQNSTNFFKNGQTNISFSDTKLWGYCVSMSFISNLLVIFLAHEQQRWRRKIFWKFLFGGGIPGLDQENYPLWNSLDLDCLVPSSGMQDQRITKWCDPIGNRSSKGSAARQNPPILDTLLQCFSNYCYVYIYILFCCLKMGKNYVKVSDY